MLVKQHVFERHYKQVGNLQEIFSNVFCFLYITVTKLFLSCVRASRNYFIALFISRAILLASLRKILRALLVMVSDQLLWPHDTPNVMR